jgi:fibronectin-binding autotransporter adhesin
LSYWDHNGATAGAGSTTPSGSWGTAASWSPSAAGTAATAGWASGDVADFSAGSDATGAFTVTLSASQTASGVTIEEGTITFATGTLDLSGAGTIDVASSLTITMSSSLSISGSSGLVKTGAGTLVLISDNRYTGDTTISGGTVSINSTSDLGSQLNPATLHLSGGTLTTTASRSPTTALIGNPIDVTADSAITTTSTAGTVDLNFFNTATAAAGSTLTFQNNAASGSGVFSPRFSGGNFTYNGKIAINNGAFGTTVLQAFNIFTNDQTFNGVISGNGSFKRTASTSGQGGNTIFTAANTFSGGTALNDGGIGLGIDSTGTPGALTSGPIGTGPLTTGANAKVFAVGGPRTVGNAIVFGGAGFALVVTGSNDLTLGGDVSLGTSSRTFQVDSGGATTVSGVISGTANLTKTGSGALTLSGTNTYSGNTNVNAGVLAIASNANLGGGNVVLGGGMLRALAAIPTPARDITVNTTGGAIDSNGNAVAFGNVDGTGPLTKNGAGALTVTHVRTAGSLTINGGSVVIAPQADPHAPASSAGVSKCATLTASTGKLDIGNGKLILTTAGATGTFNGTAYTGVTGLIATGRDGGGWNGSSGIVTSQSAATGGNFTTIGIATAAQAKGIASTATAVWAGQTVTGSATLVMYTYGGDANLDGKLNVDDYGRIDSNIGLGNGGWYNGDFNYDGKVNVDDYGVIDSNIGIQGPPFSTTAAAQRVGVAAVPEPGAGVVLVIVGAIVPRRRRRT